MTSGANLVVHVFASRHPYHLGVYIHVDPFAVNLVLIWVVRVDPLDREILGVYGLIGDTPRDVLVVTHHHPRHPGKGESDHVGWAISG